MCQKASTMRQLLATVGGPLAPTENRKGWLRRVARVAGISDRSARAAFYGELRGDTHAAGIEAKLRAAAERLEAENKKKQKAARDEIAELMERVARLEQRLARTDSDFFGPDIQGHRAVLHPVSGKDPPA